MSNKEKKLGNAPPSEQDESRLYSDEADDEDENDENNIRKEKSRVSTSPDQSAMQKRLNERANLENLKQGHLFADESENETDLKEKRNLNKNATEEDIAKEKFNLEKEKVKLKLHEKMLKQGQIKKPSKKSKIRATIKSWFAKAADLLFGNRKKEITNSEKIEYLLVELCFYLCFVFLTTFIAFYTVTPNMYFMTRSIKKALVDSKFWVGPVKYQYMDIHEPGDVFDFIEGKIIPTLMPKAKKTSKSLLFGFDDSLIHEDREPLTENYMVVNPIIRMVAVKPKMCDVHPIFEKVFSDCHDYYSRDNEFDLPIPSISGSLLHWKNEDSTIATPYEGVISTYDINGYIHKMEKNKLSGFINELKKTMFLSRKTRVIFLDIGVYNPSVNLFCFIKFVFEQPPTGGILPTYELRTVKLITYVNTLDHFVYGCQMAVIVILVVFTAEAIIKIVFLNFRFFMEFWNYIDLTILAIFWYYVIVVLRLGDLGNTVLDTINQRNMIPEKQINMAIKANDALALGMFFVWCKLFKYVVSVEGMGNLSKTIARSFWILLNFAMVFFVVFLSFAIIGYSWFGREGPDYQSVTASCLTLIRIILADLDYKQIELIDPYLAFLFFSSYVFFVIFILLNVFVAILNESYTVIKNEEVFRTSNRVTIWSYLTSPLKRKLLTLTRHPSDIEPQAKYELSMAEFKDIFRKHNFTETEIFSFLCKYNLEGTQYFTEARLRSLCSEMESVFFNPMRPADYHTAARMDITTIKNAKDNVRQNQRAKMIGLVLKNFDHLLRRINAIEAQLEILADRLLEILSILEKSGRDIFTKETEANTRKKKILARKDKKQKKSKEEPTIEEKIEEETTKMDETLPEEEKPAEKQDLEVQPKKRETDQTPPV